MTSRLFVCLLLCLSLAISARAEETKPAVVRWWPAQKTAASLAVLAEVIPANRDWRDNPRPWRGSRRMLAESLAGLAAQAVNEGRGNELVWIDEPGKVSYVEWRKRLLERTKMQPRQVGNVWDLARDYAQRGIVKGYVLYKAERRPRDRRRPGEPCDESANVATVEAGLLGGVLVEEEMRPEAEAAGLKLLFDARGMTTREIFEKEKDRLDRHAALVQSPDLPFCRDIAIAHRLMVCYGQASPTPEIYHWLEPMSVVFGWNSGDEGTGVLQASREGCLFVAADWASNLTALSAGAPETLSGLHAPPFRRPPAAPAGKTRHAVAAMMSDGDNLQWLLSTFVHNPNYWASPERNRRPMGWGLPLGDLLQVAPDVYNALAETQGANTSALLHLGYYYPDAFGAARGPQAREDLLRRLGARVEAVFQATGTTLLTFIARDLHSDGARQSYRLLAESIPSLSGVFALQYDPYEGGAGEVFWVKGSDGRDVPVVTAAYDLWNLPGGPRRGSPTGMAGQIVARAKATGDTAPPINEWAVVHAWSDFPQEKGNLPRGVLPTMRFFDEVSSVATPVSPQELVERIRREHRP